jgi:predicted Fe-Mo cluster-binding NifX family protein
MRIVYPTDENMGYLSRRGAHFGKAKFYTIITLEGDKIVDVESVQNPGHSGGACGNAVANILSLNPDALVVGGIGASPAQGFYKAGLDVYVDRISPTVEESVKLFAQGKLEKLQGSGTCSVH